MFERALQTGAGKCVVGRGNDVMTMRDRGDRAQVDKLEHRIGRGFDPYQLGVCGEIGRAHVCTPVTNAQLVCRLLLEKHNTLNTLTSRSGLKVNQPNDYK